MIVIDFVKRTSKANKQLISDAVMFASSQLFPRIKKPVFINIEAVRNLAEEKGVYGDVLNEDDREFTIRVDPGLDKDVLVSTVLHEMVHVGQYLSARMVQNWSNEIRFDRVVYQANMAYDDRPWEIEAHAKEKQLKDLLDGQTGY